MVIKVNPFRSQPLPVIESKIEVDWDYLGAK